MPDPIARKRLKKKMLDRWENEGGKIAIDTTSADASSEDRDQTRTRSSQSDDSTVDAVSSTKRRKPTRK